MKESLFSIIQAYVPDAAVLDLFAGSGALALEALSRGAGSAALVDMDREAAGCIRRNIEKLGFRECARLYQCEWRQALGRIKRDGLRFDLVFLDPPYRMTQLNEFCAALAKDGLLSDGAMLALEHRGGITPALGSGFTPYGERKYGDTEIHFFLYHEEEDAS